MPTHQDGSTKPKPKKTEKITSKKTKKDKK